MSSDRTVFRPGTWLLIGTGVTALAGMRYNVAILGWISAVPWLMYLRSTSGWRSSLVFAGTLQVAMFLSIVKIITDPLPWPMALMFSIPMGIGATVMYLGFEALRRRLGDRWGLVLLPAIAVVGEWLSANGSELGSWGALAYTQIDNLPLMQTASVFGLSGISVLLAATSGIVAVAIAQPNEKWWQRPAAFMAAAVFAAHAWGSVRLFAPIEGPTLTVATVVSDVRMSPGALPDDAELDRATDALFARTEDAIARGARLIVWNEGATAVNEAHEAAFLDRASTLARRHQVDIVVAYVVPLDGLKHFENKYAWVSPDGVLEDYFKHHPVPGEGSVKGEEPLVVHERPYGSAAGAICYDYDFPALALEHARLGADIVAVPSSDWAGIDPFHTQMAAVRGIEGGFSVVRSVRHATSGAFDAYGVARGLASEREGERLMIATVPAKRVKTIYSRIGDVLPLAAGVALAAGLLAVLRRRFRRRRDA